jgi:hypothetical protein
MRRAAFAAAAVAAARMFSGAVAASVLAVGMLAAPAAGATSAATCPSSGKCFAVTVSPSDIPAGRAGPVGFTITNEASTQHLGSVKVTAPASFTITAAPGSATFTASSAIFLNLSLAPSATTTVTVSATAPCGTGAYRWGAQAKQSNDFNGPPGNDFQLDPASGVNLSGALTGSCKLAFPPDGQPAGTAAGGEIKSGFGSTGGPVKVEILDGSGQLATGTTAPVAVAIGSNPGSGSLSGTAVATTSGGIASFSGLSIDKPGIGYALSASTSSPGITPAVSADFTIWGSLQHCSTAPCSASASTKTTTGTVSTSSAAAADYLGAGLGGVSYSCPGSYQPVSDPVSFDVLSSSGTAQSAARFVVSLEISKARVQTSGRPGASSWQICYASLALFTARDGTTSGTATIGGVSYHTGLLPDCSASQGAPCVQSRTKDNAGNVLVTFLAVGDPVGRG